MPLRREPTLRQRRLGAEMRRMREQAGLGGSQLARELGLAPTQVTQMENGKIGVSAERLRTVAAACSCSNTPLIEALAEMAAERRKGWWEKYRGTLSTDFLEIAELEANAHRISTWATAYLPGLQQTEAYASAVFSRFAPFIPSHDLDARTTFRMQRKEAVRHRGVPYASFIHEAALRMQFGGPRVLADQLDHLIDDSLAGRISVRVVPFDLDTFPGCGENIMFVEGPVPELATLQMDTVAGCMFFDAQASLGRHRSVFEHLDSSALAEAESREFIRSIGDEMRGKYA